MKRILISRTDRIGDVVLSTPVTKVLRDNFPDAYIAIMVTPVTQEIVMGNPYLDEVIVYDKAKAQKGIIASLRFALMLRKKRFDLAIILHSTNRINIINYLAGIKQRVGYSRRMGFLLTKNVPYFKYKGEKHEVEYNLDLLRSIGIEVKDTSLFIPEDRKSDKWAEDVLNSYGVKDKDRLVIIHPSASCLSCVWPLEKFAEVANNLIKKYNVKIVIVSGPDTVSFAHRLVDLITYSVINIAGKASLMQLASISRKATLMISNDSGPVHIAVACGLPVIALFGRNQPGLSPRRWGPRGERDVVLHKKMGCQECLAHDCQKGFICLKSIKVTDVLDAVDRIIKVC